jgi:hypothetical protein
MRLIAPDDSPRGECIRYINVILQTVNNRQGHVCVFLCDMAANNPFSPSPLETG